MAGRKLIASMLIQLLVQLHLSVEFEVNRIKHIKSVDYITNKLSIPLKSSSFNVTLYSRGNPVFAI